MKSKLVYHFIFTSRTDCTRITAAISFQPMPCPCCIVAIPTPCCIISQFFRFQENINYGSHYWLLWPTHAIGYLRTMIAGHDDILCNTNKEVVTLNVYFLSFYFLLNMTCSNWCRRNNKLWVTLTVFSKAPKHLLEISPTILLF